MIVGAHVSSAGGVSKAFERAKEIEAECFQIFVSPPQMWAQTKHKPEEIEAFAKLNNQRIAPNFIHATYLINLATQNPEHLQKSIDWLKYGLDLAYQLQITGVIFHQGSHKGNGFDAVLKQITDSIKKILDQTPNKDNLPYLILENSAGSGDSIGSSFAELGAIIRNVGSPRLKVCLDTQHAFAAGYDFRDPKLTTQVFDQFDKDIGLERLVVIHANDSKVELGGAKDRHQNIGDGFIGKTGFRNIVNEPRIRHLPLILEVPGINNTGPDLENIRRLKQILT